MLSLVHSNEYHGGQITVILSSFGGDFYWIVYRLYTGLRVVEPPSDLPCLGKPTFQILIFSSVTEFNRVY